MNNSENNRKIQSAWYLSFLVFLIYVCFHSLAPKGLNGSQSELTLIQASASWSSQQQTSLLWQTSSTSCIAVTDVTLAIDIDDMTHEVHLNAPMKSQFKQMNTSGCRSLEGHQNISSCSCECQLVQMLHRNLTVVDIIIVPFVYDIIKFRFCICSKSVS